MKKEAIGILFIICTSSAAQATLTAEIEETPDLIAGCDELIEITFRSDEKTTVWMSYNIQPSGEGMTISFSEESFTFKGTKTVEATIQTSPALMPEEYTIQIDYKYIIKEEESPIQDDGPAYRSRTRAPSAPEDTEDTEETTDEEPTDEEPTDEEPPSEARIQQGTITFSSGTSKKENNIIGTLAWISIFSLLFIIIVIFKRREKKEE